MKLDPKLFEAAYWYGMALQAEGRFEDAVKMFDRASTLRPEDYQSAHFLGQAYRSLGKHEDETAHLRRGLSLMEGSLELNPDDARAANLAAGVFASLGEAEPALKYAERSLAIDPEDPMLLYNVACTYASLWTESIRRYHVSSARLKKDLVTGNGSTTIRISNHSATIRDTRT